MASQNAFEPQWTSAPGETISEILRKRNIDLSSFASDMGETQEDAECLLSGQCAIDRPIAERLNQVIGGSISFWLKREAQYRDDIARLNGAREHEDAAKWLRELPVADMTNFGWINRFQDRAKQAKECLRFFGVPTISAWHSEIGGLQSVVAFRTSKAPSAPGSVAAWLRQGELLASNIGCAEWNSAALQAALKEMRTLTRVKDPAIFIPALRKICASCGVALVILRAPKGCRASGATKFMADGRALVLLSFRYRSDDHFWFTFFHEMGHLLLHDRTALFIEGADFISTHEEKEADGFSEEFLIPRDYRRELFSLPHDHRKIMRFARKIGISAGIIVGQLQHAHLLAPAKMNFLKVRYTWGD